jgi:hypothetical protein
MSDLGRLSVHKTGSTYGFSSVRFGDALMPEANTKDRNFRAKAEDKVFAYPRFARRAGSWGDTNMLRR